MIRYYPPARRHSLPGFAVWILVGLAVYGIFYGVPSWSDPTFYALVLLWPIPVILHLLWWSIVAIGVLVLIGVVLAML